MVQWTAMLRQLQQHFHEVNHLKFDGRLPAVTLTVNPRLRALTGRVFYDEQLIELSGFHLCRRNRWQVATQTLEHEMLHLYLDTLGLPPGHTRTFKQLAHEKGISVWHSLPYPRNRNAPVRHVYECPCCARRVSRNRRLSEIRRHACGECCRRHNGGAFDPRFQMRWVETVHLGNQGTGLPMR